MRTTVTLDADAEALLRQEMTRRRLSFKAALNEAIRRAFHPAGGAGRRYQVKPFRSKYRPGVDRLRLSQLADELESDVFLQAQRRRR